MLILLATVAIVMHLLSMIVNIAEFSEIRSELKFTQIILSLLDLPSLAI